MHTTITDSHAKAQAKWHLFTFVLQTLVLLETTIAQMTVALWIATL